MAETKQSRPKQASKSKTPRKPATKSGQKKRPTKKKQTSWLAVHWPQLTALVFSLLSVLAIFKVGLLGKFFANVIRWFVGGSYQLFLVILLVPLLVVIAYNQWPKKIKKNQYIGFAMFYLGLCLSGSILLFSKMNIHTDFITHVSDYINQDMANAAVSTPVGGGVLGAALYQVSHLLLGNFGAWLVAILLIVIGVIVTFNVPVREVFDNFFNLAEGTGDYVQVKANNVHETVTEKVTDFKERQKHAMTDVFNDDPFGAGSQSQPPELPDASVGQLDDHQVDDGDGVEATSAEFKMPEIVAPEAKPQETATTATVDDDFTMPTPFADGLPDEVPPLPQERDAPQDAYDSVSDFDANQVIQSPDAAVEPVTYGEDVSDADLDMPLTHADVVGHNDSQTNPKTQAHQSDVGHVEPSTKSVPTEDVDASGLGTVIDDAHYQLPSPDLLTEIGSTDQSAERDALNEKARILHETLKSFHINATVEKVVLGPTVTQYEIKPAVGVKVSKIQNLADDLALSLSAKSLRIEAPIPGKNVVGIEVANDQQATVGFKDMVEEAGIDTKHPLTVPIGRGVTSGVVKMDLTKMPHLLIAGSTGSGKSVAINGILASILLQAKPSQVRLMLVDPKKVELSVYNDIPHLITPVVSDPKKASLGLKKVVAEMDRRFKLLADAGVRNMDGYNRYVEKQNAKDPSTVLQSMPYLVVVIDELADLMMTSSVSGDVENAIVRIAQLGRAAGIHMIVATQRPSVDIITGLIKANVPSRMAFAVSSGVDSRTILDQNGAEKLLGRGDMLFAPIGASGPQRVQGAFISDEDVENLTDFIKDQGEAQYDENMTVSDAEVQSLESGQNGGADELDELWDEVLEFVLRAGGASTSSIQRHFKIGYNRAGRIIDDMSDRGLIGPQNGSKPREINFTAEMLPNLKRQSQN
ncbi:DNA translocase FtsK [Weissella viridescens]|uniref:DNA translocase FtsK n=1 Tax=Weissella viridescens TaxID=1629 RepID=A0A3P2RBJ0_WEIVI|nr:DNA translocase FtsK [Weissella viridescens]RRG17933.1 DNA translocase FtsK [Weissella viridescens]